MFTAQNTKDQQFRGARSREESPLTRVVRELVGAR